jgi:hypothetical protein
MDESWRAQAEPSNPPFETPEKYDELHFANHLNSGG